MTNQEPQITKYPEGDTLERLEGSEPAGVIATSLSTELQAAQPDPSGAVEDAPGAVTRPDPAAMRTTWNPRLLTAPPRSISHKSGSGRPELRPDPNLRVRGQGRNTRTSRSNQSSVNE